MTVSEGSVLDRLTKELGLGHDEASAYLQALKQGFLPDSGVTGSLLRRGMLIRQVDEKGYLPVHPRLALSNLFRSFGERSTPAMREKRRMVDRLTAELIVIYESGRRSK